MTDTSFQRREWAPLRQKPYWITYTKKQPLPTVKDGHYVSGKVYVGMDSVALHYNFSIDLLKSDFTYTVF